MAERKGPWKVFDYGTYKNHLVEDVIEKDPMFFANCVKQFLNISPKQRDKFSEITGYDIPEKYVDETYQEIPDKTVGRWPFGIEPNCNFDNEKF